MKELLCGITMAVLAALPQANGSNLEVTLTWDSPVCNTDGSPLTNLCGYTVYYGTASRTYDHRVDLADVTQGTIGNLEEGRRYFFAVSARNAEHTESAVSEEAAWDAPAGDPPDGPEIRAISVRNEAHDEATLSWRAEAGRTYQVQMSADLLTWEPAPSGTESVEQSTQAAPADGTLAYRDVAAATVDRRFYRIRLIE